MSTRVFISHAHEDAARCAPLLRVLGAWGVEYWFDSPEERAGGQLSGQAQSALATCDVLLRICTSATKRSYWMSLEAGAFLSQMADDHRREEAGRRRMVNLILDPAYQREPFDASATVVDATNRVSPDWVNQLRRALNLAPLDDAASIATQINPPQPEGISRRKALGLAVGGAAALALAGAGGLVVLQRSRIPAPPGPAPTPTAVPPSRDARLRWWLAIGKPSPQQKTDNAIAASPVLDGNTLYVGTLADLLYALNRADGKPLWQFGGDTPAGAIYTTPAVADGVVYVVRKGSGIFAVQNGAKLWSNSIEVPNYSIPVVANGLLYVNSVGAIRSFVSAFDLSSGTHKFDIYPPVSVDSYSGPTVAGGKLYEGGIDGYLYALDATRSGAHQFWRAETGAAAANRLGQPNDIYVAARPTVADGVVYAGSLDAKVYAIHADTGAKRWTFTAKDKISRSSPAVAGGIVYIGSEDKSIYALDAADGKQRWSYATGGSVLSSPAVAENVVYVGSNDASVYALDARTGALIHRYQTAAAVVVQPAVADGVLHAADVYGYVYAFEAAQ
jgi:outer membrane protein assembly factor BamB